MEDSENLFAHYLALRSAQDLPAEGAQCGVFVLKTGYQ
ncbi:hypothetical protein BH09VER1_BH09VER1_29870 [soil metagenome]